nr:facilitated trehalose transporter Tret1-like [Dermacentor andersoni]
MTVSTHHGPTEASKDGDTAARGRRRLYLAVAATYFGTVSTGLTCAYSSPALPDMRRTMHISDDFAAWFGALVLAGGLVAGVISGHLLSLTGRRGTMLMSAAWFAAGWLFIAFANSTTLLFVGRFLTGGGMSVASAASTVFVAEVTPANLRGALNTGCNFVETLGILIGYTMGKWLNYKWLAAACLVPAVINGATFLFYVRESPMWLLQKGRRKEAMEALRFYRGPRVEDEFAALETCTVDVTTKLTFGDLKEPYVYKSFLCSLLTLLMQQGSAISILIFFAQDILQEADVSIAADDCTIVVGGILSVAFLVATVLADKAGRKWLFIVSTASSAVSLAVLGVCFYMKQTKNQHFHDNYGWLPLASMSVYFAGYSLGLGPLPFVYVGELLPLKTKGVATAVCIVLYYCFGFLVTKTYTDLSRLMGTAAAYWLYASFLAVTFVLFVIYVPETKAKTLDEIERYFGKKLPSPQLSNVDELVTSHL